MVAVAVAVGEALILPVRQIRLVVRVARPARLLPTPHRTSAAAEPEGRLAVVARATGPLVIAFKGEWAVEGAVADMTARRRTTAGPVERVVAAGVAAVAGY